MKEKNWKKWIGMFLFCIMLISFYKLLDNFGDIFSWITNLNKILMPFILALILAYIFYIPCRKIESDIGKIKIKFIAKRKRGISTLIVYLLAIFSIFVVIRFVFPVLTSSIADLASQIPSYYRRAIEYFSSLSDDSIWKKLNVADAVLSLQQINITDKIMSFLTFDNVFDYIKGVMGAASVLFDAFVTIIVSVYLILERSDIKSFLSNLSKALFSKDVYGKVAKYYEETNSVFFNYISSQVLDGFIIGIITSVAMSIMKVKYALLLGFLIGLFNIIPYFGAIAAIAISVIITIFTGGPVKAIWMAITVIILQQIDANIINPRILGNSLHLSPILVIASVTIFGSYFGVLGMFLGVPIAAMIKLLVLDFIDERKKEKLNEIEQK